MLLSPPYRAPYKDLISLHGKEGLDVFLGTNYPDIKAFDPNELRKPNYWLNDDNYANLRGTMVRSGIDEALQPFFHAVMKPGFTPPSADAANPAKHKAACGGQCKGHCGRPTGKQACKLTGLLDKVCSFYNNIQVMYSSMLFTP